MKILLKKVLFNQTIILINSDTIHLSVYSSGEEKSIFKKR